MSDESVTAWLRQIGQGNQEAALQLWLRYARSLERLVRSRHVGALNAAANEEDLVQSVFHALWSGAAAGQWDNVQNRMELWWVLLAITRHKALKRQTYNARLKRGQSPESLSDNMGSHDVSMSHHATDIAADTPPPDLIIILQEERERLLASLRDDVLRSIAVWKLEGYTHEEIAGKINVTPRTIIRKVNMIRETWSE